MSRVFYANVCISIATLVQPEDENMTFRKKREKKLLSLTFHRMNPVVRTGVGWLVAESSEDQVITFSASHPVPLSWRIRSVGLIVGSIIVRNQFIFISTQR